MSKTNTHTDSHSREPVYLVIEKGGDSDGRFPIYEGESVVGNSPLSDIVINNPFVSRKHLSIRSIKSSYYITDLGSKNGTSIDHVPLRANERRELDDGTLISLAQDEVLLRFRKTESTLQQIKTGGSEPIILVDPITRDVTVRQKTLNPPLSKKEFDVLWLLFQNKGDAVDRDMIAEQGWPERTEGDVGNQEIEQCISRIRRRIELRPGNPELILTLRSFGYKMP